MVRFRQKPIKPPMSVCKPSAYVLCLMCPIESKLSVVHICHNTKSHFVPLANRHRAINIQNIGNQSFVTYN